MSWASSALQGVSNIAGGYMTQHSDNAEAGLIQQQGATQYQEARIDATNEAVNQNTTVGRQTLAFLANGISLEGSPAVVLAQSKAYGQSQVDAILRKGQAQADLANAQAKQLKQAGKAAMLGGWMGGATDASKSYAEYLTTLKSPSTGSPATSSTDSVEEVG